MQAQDSERILYLAMPSDAYQELSQDVFDYPPFEALRSQLIIYHLTDNTALIWIK